jgi:hypothetical protein
MKLEYLQYPTQNISAWGGGLSEFGKGIKETAQFNLDLIDKNKAQDIANRQENRMLESSKAVNRYYGNLADKGEFELETAKERAPKDNEIYNAQADVQLKQSAIELKQAVLQLEREGKRNINTERLIGVKVARLTDNPEFKKMNDNDILDLIDNKPALFDQMISESPNYQQLANWFNADGSQVTTIAEPKTGRTKQVVTGTMTDEQKAKLTGSGAANKMGMGNYEKDDDSKGYLFLNSTTGEYVPFDTGAQSEQEFIVDPQLSKLIHLQLTGKNPTGVFNDDITPIGKEYGNSAFFSTNGHLNGSYLMKARTMKKATPYFKKGAIIYTQDYDGNLVASLNPEYAKNPMGVFAEQDDKTIAEAYTNQQFDLPLVPGNSNDTRALNWDLYSKSENDKRTVKSLKLNP